VIVSNLWYSSPDLYSNPDSSPVLADSDLLPEDSDLDSDLHTKDLDSELNV